MSDDNNPVNRGATVIPLANPSLATLTCPDALRNIKAWVVWRYQQNSDNKKPRKVPYYVGGGLRTAHGSPKDIECLALFDAAKSAAIRGGFDGVGFATLAQFGVVAADWDDCVTDGQVLPDVEKLCAGTYAEYSPSGRGVRAFYLGVTAWGNSKDLVADVFGCGFELFATKGFVTFTGALLPSTVLYDCENTIGPGGAAFTDYCQRRFGAAGALADGAAAKAPVGYALAALSDALAALSPDCGYHDWLRVGMALHHECEGGSEGLALWDQWSSQGASYPGVAMLEGKWDSFGRSAEAGAVTAAWLVRSAIARGADLDACGDVVALFRDAEAFEPVAGEDKPAAPGKSGRFKFWNVPDFLKRSPPEYLIDGVLPDADLCFVYGASASGKTFAALDMAVALALGEPWRGLAVKQGPVLYVCAEGAGGFRNRLDAVCQDRRLAPDALPITILDDAPDLLDGRDTGDVRALLRGIKETGQGFRLVIIDTLAQTTPGANENSGEDMGKALGHCKAIRKVAGCPVLLIHHSGKDEERGMRGWSGIRGAADAIIEVTREGAARAMAIRKMKDGEDGAIYPFTLRTVPIFDRATGEAMAASCVVQHLLVTPGEQADAAALAVEAGRAARIEGLKPEHRVVFDVLTAQISASATGLTTIEAVKAAAAGLLERREGKPDTRKSLVRGYLAALERAKLCAIDAENNMVRLVNI